MRTDSSRRHLLHRSLEWAGLALGGAVLAGCASSPSKTAVSGASGPSRGGKAGTPGSAGSAGGMALGDLPQPSRLGGSLITLPGTDRPSVVQAALQQQGVPYRWAGNSPDEGFDCSGLMVYAFQQALGVGLPRQTADQAAVSRPVAPERLQPGDFVFFNTLGRPFSHLGLFIGAGQFVHAPATGGRVSLARLDNRYFAPRFNGARTVFI